LGFPAPLFVELLLGCHQTIWRQPKLATTPLNASHRQTRGARDTGSGRGSSPALSSVDAESDSADPPLWVSICGGDRRRIPGAAAGAPHRVKRNATMFLLGPLGAKKKSPFTSPCTEIPIWCWAGFPPPLTWDQGLAMSRVRIIGHLRWDKVENVIKKE